MLHELNNGDAFVDGGDGDDDCDSCDCGGLLIGRRRYNLRYDSKRYDACAHSGRLTYLTNKETGERGKKRESLAY